MTSAIMEQGSKGKANEEDSGNFLCFQSSCSIQIDGDEIFLKYFESSNVTRSRSTYLHDQSIKLVQVISTSYKADKTKTRKKVPLIFQIRQSTTVQREIKDCFTLTINFWTREEKYKRKLQTVKLQTFQEKDCTNWKKLIDDKLEQVLNKQGYTRPQNLLVFVNPFSGKKKGKQVYDKVVSPLFKTAGIRETVIYTQYSGHAIEYIESHDISKYDGIIGAGGDGTICEIANAVMIKEQKKRGIPFNGAGACLDSQQQHFVKPGLRLGTLPVGSGNALHRSSQGTEDCESAALQIICGERHSLDVSSVYDAKGQFVQFLFMTGLYGIFAKSLKVSDNLSIFGPLRYHFSMLRNLLRNETYSCEISYLLSSPKNSIDLKKEDRRCRHPCSICLDERSKVEVPISDSPSSRKPRIENTWKVLKGRFNFVHFCPISLMCEKTPEGLAPAAHLSNGAADLVLLHSTSRSELFSYILSLREPKARLDFPSLEYHRVKAFSLKILNESALEPSSERNESAFSNSNMTLQPSLTEEDDLLRDNKQSVWADNEFLTGSSHSFYVHRGLIDMFAKGVEEELK